MRRERLFLEDILTAAGSIAEFIQAQDFRLFEANHLLRSAVVSQLTIIGEAVAHISADLQARHPSIPWADIRAFRNIVVHNYFGIDWEEVWRTAAEDVPLLRRQVAEILCQDFSE